MTVLFATATAVLGQSVFTIAGGGIPDGRPAVVTPVSGGRMAVDSRNRLYFGGSGLVKRIGANGLLETYAGNGARTFGGDGGNATAAALASVADLVFDGEDNLYIADDDNGRIRRVDARTGIITTVAGGGAHRAFGEGLAATEVALHVMSGLALDRGGNLLMVQANAVRCITRDGILQTVAGSSSLFNDTQGWSGDGGPATLALLDRPTNVVADEGNNLFIADGGSNRIRRVDAATQRITTYAGTGAEEDSGDGGPAVDASIYYPLDLAFDSAGNLLVVTARGNLRRIDARTGVIDRIHVHDSDGSEVWISGVAHVLGTTYVGSIATIWRFTSDPTRAEHVAGNGDFIFTGDGGPATAAELFQPVAVVVDAAGDLYVSDLFGTRRVDPATRIISSMSRKLLNTRTLVACRGFLYADENGNTIWRIDPRSGARTHIAGSGARGNSGDDGPAILAAFEGISGLAADERCNLFVADSFNHTVRRIDAETGTITSIAGTGAGGYNGDNGDAKKTMLYVPAGVVLDSLGSVYVADAPNYRIMKVTVGNGQIATVARFANPTVGLTSDGSGILYCTVNSQIFRVDPKSGTTSLYAGARFPGFSGDNNAATRALFNFGDGGAIDVGGLLFATPSGDLYVADNRNDRVRVIPACRDASQPALERPANRASSEATAPRLSWSRASGAQSYDLYLSAQNPPQTIVALDLTLPTYSPANLEPLTTYYWRVVAKGDPFCAPFSAASSEVWSFTTTGTCSAPGAFESAAQSTSASGGTACF